ncbi:MAG: DUF3035 domain-containing protein [Pseudomonadota bacterium]
MIAMTALRLLFLVLATCLATACARETPDLLSPVSDRSGEGGPDEFAVVPAKPLEIPENLAALPPPTPGGGNRADQNPQADVVAALGGSPGRISRDGTVRGETALLAHAGRFGTQPGIRDQLAAEDLAFRKANRGRFLEVAFGLNTYFLAYTAQSLDQYNETLRLRAAGVRTSAVPPPPEN